MEIELTDKQTEARKYLVDDDDCSLLYGGAKGGGKSYFLCLWAVEWSLWLAKFFGLERSLTPLPVGFIGRKRAIDFNDTNGG